MNLTTISQAILTQSSDLLSVINEARIEYGEKEVRRNDFIARCKDELDGDHYESFVVTNPNGTESEELRLTDDQCAYISMRESKSVRRRVTEKLNAARAPKFDPATLTRIDILKLAMESEDARIKAESERDHAIATKSQIGSRREATAIANVAKANKEVARLKDQLGFSVRQATILQVEDADGHEFDFLPLRRWCNAHEVVAQSVPDKRYPKGVKAWPAAAWQACYDIDLSKLFQGA